MERYIGMPLEKAKEELEKQGFFVKTKKCSLPKIKTDSELVVSLKRSQNTITLYVGDFLIGV